MGLICFLFGRYFPYLQPSKMYLQPLRYGNRIRLIFIYSFDLLQPTASFGSVVPGRKVVPTIGTFTSLTSNTQHTSPMGSLSLSAIKLIKAQSIHRAFPTGSPDRPVKDREPGMIYKPKHTAPAAVVSPILMEEWKIKGSAEQKSRTTT